MLHITCWLLPPVPLLALTLGPLLVMLIEHRALPVRVASRVLLGIGVCVCVVMTPLKQAPYRVAFAQMARDDADIGAIVDHTDHAIYLTCAYGEPLRYYGQLGGWNWPNIGDMIYDRMQGKPVPSAAERLDGLLAQTPYDYFIITDFLELRRQPDLLALLQQRYGDKAVAFARGRYLIVKLR